MLTAFYFGTLGIASIIFQLVLFRELSITFLGNEIIYAVGFLLWFTGTAIGSLIPIAKIWKKYKEKPYLPLIWLNAALLLLLFVPILTIRAIPLLNSFTGEISPLWHLYLVLPLAIMPPCIVFGIQFGWGTHLVAKLEKNKLPKISHLAYIWEIAGFVMGGIFFNLILVHLTTIDIVQMLLMIEFLLLYLILRKYTLPRKSVVISLTLAIFGFGLLMIYSRSMEFSTHAWRFEGQELVDTQNTRYGNISITRSQNQYNFYQNGVLLGTDNDQAQNERLAHIPLLAHPKPDDVLILGSGFNGLVKEIFKHPVQNLTYVELDLELISLAADYLPSDQRAVLGHPDISIIYKDGIDFLRHTQDTYDVILVNIPDPSNYFLDRFYTSDFFSLAGGKLNQDGLLTIDISAAPNQLTQAQKLQGASLLAALNSNFEQVELIHDGAVQFVAFKKTSNQWDPGSLAVRLTNRDIKSDFVSAKYLDYQLDPARKQQILEQYDQAVPKQQNTNLHPVSYYYATLAWATLSSDTMAHLFTLILEYKWLVAVFLALLGSGVCYLAGRKKSKNYPLFISMLTASATTMVLEIVAINLFQVFFGFVFSMVSLIIIVLMLGMLIGNVLIDHLHQEKIKIDTQKWLLSTHILLSSCLLIFAGAIYFLQHKTPDLLVLVIIPVLLALVGILEGFVFPLANGLYHKQNKKAKSGFIYSADIIGAGLGTILFSVLVMPLFGLIPSILILTAINLTTILILRKI